jgi:uncharacterized protein YwgA
MKRNQKLVILSRVARELVDRGSWAGEIHLQKAVYLLQEITEVPLGYPFILYHFGPFSFELREELNRMRAGGLLELVARPYPYGPSFRSTPPARDLENRFPRTLEQFSKEIEFVSKVVGSRSAAELERLSTAVYLLKSSSNRDLPQLARELNQLKPHVSVESATESLEEMRKTLADAGSVR